MNFNVIANSTITDINRINENFYYVGRGNRLPMEGTELRYTNNSSNLGVSATTWNNCFVKNVYTNSITTSDQSIYSLVTSVAVTAATDEIQISGLNGDGTEEYLVIADITTSGTTYLQLIFNATAASSFNTNEIQASSTGYRAWHQGGLGVAFVGLTGDTANDNNVSGFSKFFIYPMTGMYRTGHGIYSSFNDGTQVLAHHTQNFMWTDTSSTITSLIFNTSNYNMLVGSKIYLFKRS